jgi:WD40 repeat protein
MSLAGLIITLLADAMLWRGQSIRKKSSFRGCVWESRMQWQPRFSLRVLLLLVAIAAVATFVSLHGRRWHNDYLDWVATRAVRARAVSVFRDETGKNPPAELVHILGSGELSHWARVYDIGLTAEQIISCGQDQAVRCWSTDSGDCLQVISNVEGHVAAKSALLVTIDKDQQVQVYDTSVSPLKRQRQFSIASGSTIRKAFCSPLDDILAVIYEQQPNEIQLFNLSDGTAMARLRFSHEAERVGVGFREDGRLLAACKDEFLLFDSETGDIVRQWKHDPWPFERQAIRGVVRLKAPWWLVVGVSTAIVWNEETHDWKEVQLDTGGTPDLVVPGGYHDAWVANSGTMLRVQMFQDNLSKSIARTTPVMPVTCLAFRRYSGGGQIFTLRAIGYGPGQVGLIDEYGRLLLPPEKDDHITAAGWNYSGKLLATGTSAGEIIVLRTGSWTEVKRYRAHAGAVLYVEFSPDGSALLAEENHEIAVFDWDSAKALLRKPRSLGSSREATLSGGDGRLLAHVLNEGWTLTDYFSKTVVARSDRKAPRPQPFWPQGPVWSAREQCFVFASREGFCRLKIVDEASETGPSLSVTESPKADLRNLRDFSLDDSQALYVDYAKGASRLRIWNWQTSATSTIESEPFASVPWAAFTPTGRQVGVVHQGNLVIFSQSGKQLYRQPIGPAYRSVSAIHFSPNGRYIAIVNGNGTCYLLRNPALGGLDN